MRELEYSVDSKQKTHVDSNPLKLLNKKQTKQNLKSRGFTLTVYKFIFEGLKQTNSPTNGSFISKMIIMKVLRRIRTLPQK